MGTKDQAIRKVLSATVEPLLKRNLQLEKLAATQYEGEITGKQGGDTVTVIYGSDVTLRTYTVGSQLTYDNVGITSHEIKVDTGKYFVDKMDEFEKVQLGSAMAAKIMADKAQRASYQFSKAIEDDIAALYSSAGMVWDTNGHYTSGGGSISGTSALSITSANAYEAMLNMQVLFDESDVPPENRFAVLPPWFVGKLLLDDRNVYTEAQIKQQNTAEISTPIAGFKVYKSNSVKNATTTYYPLFGVKGKSFAVIRQINPKAQDASRPDYFEEATKMALLYGVDCHRSDMLGCLVCSKGSE
jgi:hypothetical protein